MAAIGPHLRNILTRTKGFRHFPCISVPTRNSSYEGSKFLVDIDVNTKYEKTHIPEEWAFVERILPTLVVPEPKQLSEYQSGWKPQKDNVKDSPYFVPRTRNHMMPVYLYITQRGVKRHTIIRKIQGDIWQLEKDLRCFLEDIIKPSPLRLQVNEFAAKIVINGDHVNAIKYWLGEKNF